MDLLLLFWGTWGHHCTKTTLNLILGLRFFLSIQVICIWAANLLKLACGYRGEIISSSQLNTKFWDEQFLLQCPGGDNVWCGGEMDESQFTSHWITHFGESALWELREEFPFRFPIFGGHGLWFITYMLHYSIKIES